MVETRSEKIPRLRIQGFSGRVQNLVHDRALAANKSTGALVFGHLAAVRFGTFAQEAGIYARWLLPFTRSEIHLLSSNFRLTQPGSPAASSLMVSTAGPRRRRASTRTPSCPPSTA